MLQIKETINDQLLELIPQSIEQTEFCHPFLPSHSRREHLQRGLVLCKHGKMIAKRTQTLRK